MVEWVRRVLCWLQTVLSSSKVYISGHDYEVEHEGMHEVQVLKCRRCGDRSISWM